MKKWTKKGFDAFRAGTFGNGGQNLYVSANGVLQRIYNMDIDGNGHPDIPYANSHRAGERQAIKVFTEYPSFEKFELLPTNGPADGFVCDLNGDGYDDVVVVCQGNGTHADNESVVYYGSAQGLTEDYRSYLYTPGGYDVTVGDYNGNGRRDICFVCLNVLKIFTQDERGFNTADSYSVKLDKNIDTVFTADLNGDGYDDIYAKRKDGAAIVFWGSADGIRAEDCTQFYCSNSEAVALAGTTASRAGVYREWRTTVITVDGVQYCYCADGEQAYFYRYEQGEFRLAFTLPCAHSKFAAAYDIDGDGHEDIVLLCAVEDRDSTTKSYIYWNEDGSFGSERLAFTTANARTASFTASDGRVVMAVAQTGNTHTLNVPCMFMSFDGRRIADIERIEGEDCPRILFGDFRGDGKTQVVLIQHEWADRIRGNEEIYIFMGDRDGYDPARRTELLGMSAVDTHMVDFNDDGRPDIFITNCNESLMREDIPSYLYYMDESGNYPPALMKEIPTIRAHGAAVGDFSHSGYLDIITGGILNREIRILRGGPDGYSTDRMERVVFGPNEGDSYRPEAKLPPIPGYGIPEEEMKQLQTWGQMRWMYAADFNGDGWLDLFVSIIGAQHAYILWNGPEGFSRERCTALNAEGAICANVADLNRDGYPDLIVGCHYTPSKAFRYETFLIIYWGGADGYQEHRKTMLPGYAANSVCVGDFNGDGWLDIYATSYNNGRFRDLESYIYYNDHGHFSFKNKQMLWNHSGSGSIAGDFNGDGYCDLAVASHKDEGDHRTTSYIYWGSPAGIREEGKVEVPTYGPHGMSTIDPGNVMDRGEAEYYISEAYDVPASTASITYRAEFLSTSYIELSYRCGACERCLERAEWKKIEAGERFPVEGKLQYRLALCAKCACGTPRVTEVEVTFED